MIKYRTLDYSNSKELEAYIRIFWALPLEFDTYFKPRTNEFIEDWCQKAVREENDKNTFPGLALKDDQIVGLYLLRKFEEDDLTGVHIAGLWVHSQFRNFGIAQKLKVLGENWARTIGADFMNANVSVQNERMLRIMQRIDFEEYRINYRKRLRQ